MSPGKILMRGHLLDYRHDTAGAVVMVHYLED